jgi:hypothetical protein
MTFHQDRHTANHKSGFKASETANYARIACANSRGITRVMGGKEAMIIINCQIYGELRRQIRSDWEIR